MDVDTQCEQCTISEYNLMQILHLVSFHDGKAVMVGLKFRVIQSLKGDCWALFEVCTVLSIILVIARISGQSPTS